LNKSWYNLCQWVRLLLHYGSIKVWGKRTGGGENAPVGSGYTKIYSTKRAFAALAHDGSIKVWGHPNFGGKNAPAGNGYTKIYSTLNAFAILKADGSIKAWGIHPML
jgi:diketogulonate reductase-like aldo/keto reductase